MRQDLPELITFQPLTIDLAGSAFRLSAQAGWNQTEEDWQRLMHLKSGGAYVWRDQGEVRASYSLSGYGDTVWIGMILVDVAYRGAGLGKATFRSAVHCAQALGFNVLGVDATNLGEPIYTQEGFEIVRPIVRWEGIFTPTGSPNNPPHITRGLTPVILAMDEIATGQNRSDLLARLASDGTVLSYNDNAYAMWRPGRTATHLGPIVARSREDLVALLQAASPDLQRSNVICDVLSPEMDAILETHGLRPRRCLQRMTKPLAKECLCPAAVRCGAGFEFG